MILLTSSTGVFMGITLAYWVLLGGALCALITWAVIAELRHRSWRQLCLRFLYVERAAVAEFVGRQFAALDVDGDGLITLPDLDDVVSSRRFEAADHRLCLMLREHLPVVGHLAKSEYVVVAMPNCAGFATAQGVQVDTYGIAAKDLPRVAARLEAAWRKTV